MTDWVNRLLEKKPFRLVSVALANKLARIAWALLTRGETYRPYGRTVGRHRPKPNWQWQSMMRNDRAKGEENPSDSTRLQSASG